MFMGLTRETLNNNDLFANEEQRHASIIASTKSYEAAILEAAVFKAAKIAAKLCKDQEKAPKVLATRRARVIERTKAHLEVEEYDTEAVIDEDTGLISTDELELLETYHNLNGREVNDEKIQIILNRLTQAMSDLELNVYTCCVCDLFKKRKYFHHIDFRSTKQKHLIIHMNERLHYSKLKPKLPPDLLAEFDCVWTSRPELNGLLLSIDGFQNEQPPVKPKDEDIGYMCTACYYNLTRASETGNPPKHALANHLVIGTCPLPELTSMQNKMLALITTRSEVVVYRYNRIISY